MGRDKGFAAAVAAVMLAPRRRIKGTVITLPPTPKKAAMAPIRTPAPALLTLLKGRMTFLASWVKPDRNRLSRIVRPKYTTKTQRTQEPFKAMAATAPGIAPTAINRSKGRTCPQGTVPAL